MVVSHGFDKVFWGYCSCHRFETLRPRAQTKPELERGLRESSCFQFPCVEGLGCRVSGFPAFGARLYR